MPRLTMEKVSHHMRLSDLTSRGKPQAAYQKGIEARAHSLRQSSPLAAQNPAQRNSDEDVGDTSGDGLQIRGYLVRVSDLCTALRAPQCMD